MITPSQNPTNPGWAESNCGPESKVGEANPSLIPKRRGRPPKIRLAVPDPLLQSPVLEVTPQTPPESISPVPVVANVEHQPPAPAPCYPSPTGWQASKQPVPSYINIHDVVQVTNPTNAHYGVLFQVGDMTPTRVHGFYVRNGGKKEFVTVNIDECLPIGQSRVRARESTSQQWRTEMNKV